MSKAKPKRRSRLTQDERQDIIENILHLMREGPANSLLDACKLSGVSRGQFLSWVEQDKNDLKDKYASARVSLLDRMAEGLLDISDAEPPTLPTGAVDSAAVAHRKLQIDTRKWLLSKLAPKKYGERLELAGDQDSPLAIKTIERVVIKNDK